LAAAEKINASYLCRVLRLTLLAPDVVEAILDGRQGEGVTLPRLMEGVEEEWSEQRKSPGAAGHAIHATGAAVGP
jgi:hypothetical protein